MADRVVVVGGGVVGSSIAYFLANHPRFSGEVVVLERDQTYRRASSALSASAIRQQFSTAVNIEISRFGIEFLRDVGARLGTEDDRPDIGLNEPGYLFLATPAGVPVLERNHRLQREHEVDVALLDPAALAARFPWLKTEGVAAGSLGLSGEGWFDGYALLQAFRRKARSLGVRYVTQEVTGFVRERSRVRAAVLADGSTVPSDVVVNAAGPWAASVAAMLDVDLPVRARRRCVFMIASREAASGCPLVIDPSGVWFRADGPNFLCGMSPAEGSADPDDAPLEVDDRLFYDVIWPILASRVRPFEAVKLLKSWAGYYEMNTFDHNGVVGSHPSLSNVFFANGFSGHGLQQSPAVGRGLAELIVDGAYRSLDLTPLSFARILERRRLVELNVI
ncbi:MAG TPA: FAD-binding oxidoreductase [bacterium]|nr:FAD-binding oxidoreductase [bacterium]